MFTDNQYFMDDDGGGGAEIQLCLNFSEFKQKSGKLYFLTLPSLC